MAASTRARRREQPREQVSKVTKPILKSTKRGVRKAGGKANARSSLEGLLLTAAAAAAADTSEWMASEAPPKYVDSLNAKKSLSTDKNYGSEVTGRSEEGSPRQRCTQNEMSTPGMRDQQRRSLGDFLTPSRDSSAPSIPAPFFFSPFLSAIRKLTSRRSSAANQIAPGLQNQQKPYVEEDLPGDACDHSSVKGLEGTSESLLSEQAEVRNGTREAALDTELSLGETKAARERENGKVETQLGLRDKVSRTNTVSALRIQLKAAGLSTNGKKAELVDRLIEARMHENSQLPNLLTTARETPSASSIGDKSAESYVDENRARKNRARTGSACQPPATGDQPVQRGRQVDGSRKVEDSKPMESFEQVPPGSDDKPLQHGRLVNGARGVDHSKTMKTCEQVPKITQALYPEVSLLPAIHSRTGNESLPVSRKSLSRTPPEKAGPDDPQRTAPENRPTSTGNKVELPTAQSVSKKILSDDSQTSEGKRSSAAVSTGARKPATRAPRKTRTPGAEIDPAMTPNSTPGQPLLLGERKRKISLGNAASAEGATHGSPFPSRSTVKTREPRRVSSRSGRGISTENVDSATNLKASSAIERVADRNSSTSNSSSLDVTVAQDLFLQRQLEKERALDKELKQREILKRTKRPSRARPLEHEVQEAPGHQTPEVTVGKTVPHTIRQERSTNYTSVHSVPSFVRPKTEASMPAMRTADSRIPKPSSRMRRGGTDSTLHQAAGTVAKASTGLAKKAPKPTIRKATVAKASTALQSGGRVKKSHVPKRTTVARR